MWRRWRPSRSHNSRAVCTRNTMQADAGPANVTGSSNDLVTLRPARAAALFGCVRKDARSVAFVDAARYGSSDRFVAAVADHSSNLLNAAAMRGLSPVAAV
ncbi:hypothetical protein HPB50_027256 [Hyalomma asiaticum]|uniref:Uncharacterized protein n=1 Tax=Hyalomma asiaticum TaxID=266040 RepID=A0ACB7SRQ2_HYAAI|nr:hypothetical protein HPB50_027256 [Hyalomma asiaticum]